MHDTKRYDKITGIFASEQERLRAFESCRVSFYLSITHFCINYPASQISRDRLNIFLLTPIKSTELSVIK